MDAEVLAGGEAKREEGVGGDGREVGDEGDERRRLAGARGHLEQRVPSAAPG